MAVANEPKVDSVLVKCQQSLLELQESISALAPDLSRAAEAMAIRREMPERSLIGRLEQVWNRFDRLRDALQSACESLTLPLLRDSVQTLANVEEAINMAVKESTAAANWQNERSFAIQVLSALCQAQCPTNANWEPLAAFRKEAENLKSCFESIAPSDSAMDEARRAFTAFSAMYRLLAGGPALPFDERMALPEQARAAISEQIVFAALGSLIRLPPVATPLKVDATCASEVREQDAHVEVEVKITADDANARPLPNGSAEAGDDNQPVYSRVLEQPVIEPQAKSDVDLLGAAAASPDTVSTPIVKVVEGTVRGADAATSGGDVPKCETAAVVCWAAPPDDVAATEAAAASRSLSGPPKLVALNDLVWRLLRESRLAPA